MTALTTSKDFGENNPFANAKSAEDVAKVLEGQEFNSEMAIAFARIATDYVVEYEGITLKQGPGAMNVVDQGYYLIVDETTLNGTDTVRAAVCQSISHDSIVGLAILSCRYGSTTNCYNNRIRIEGQTNGTDTVRNASLLQLTKDVTITVKVDVPQVDKQVQENSNKEFGEISARGALSSVVAFCVPEKIWYATKLWSFISGTMILLVVGGVWWSMRVLLLSRVPVQ